MMKADDYRTIWFRYDEFMKNLSNFDPSLTIGGLYDYLQEQKEAENNILQLLER